MWTCCANCKGQEPHMNSREMPRGKGNLIDGIKTIKVTNKTHDRELLPGKYRGDRDEITVPCANCIPWPGKC